MEAKELTRNLLFSSDFSGFFTGIWLFSLGKREKLIRK
jgi:hypothetical protein